MRQIGPSLDLQPHPVTVVSGPVGWKEKTRRRIFLRTGYAGRFLKDSDAHRAEIIHAHFAIDACAILPLAKRLRMPLVVTLHGYDVSRNEKGFHELPTTRAYLRRKEELWKYASLFFSVSEHVRQRAIERGFPPEKLWVHRIGTRKDGSTVQNHPRDLPIVLFVGRLVEKKGCIHLLRAIPQVFEKIPDAQLVVIGDGPLRGALEREAKPWDGRVTFLGQQSHSEVKQWMGRARVLAAPSVRAIDGDEEGLPTVLCEAQSLGLPVVAFAVPGVIEALSEERRGDMPCERDESGLSEEIINLLENNDRWLRVSKSGRQYVNSHFDLEQQTRILEDKYDEVIAKHRA
ncbi:MAG TPA: glycosyltransferase [Pseudacidobacterium sp.]|nr:glycosyltransferase [Pseudacidobacterium sp.]